MSALLSSTSSAASNRTRLAATIGSAADFVTEFSYDNLQRTTGIQQHGASGGNAVADKRIDLAYNDAGQFSAISRSANLAGTQAVATSDFAYDGTGRLVALTHAQGTSTLADYTWSFDAGNRLTQFTSLHDGIADYAYDDRGQLTDSQYDYQGDESYSYDANGNRTNTGYHTGPNNQLLSDGTYNYQYDAEGNRTKKTEIASGEATEYHWDHRNRLVSVVHRDALGVPLQTVDYVYDIFDRRIGKSDTPASGPTEVESYVYDGAHVALRFIDGQLANRYLHGPAIDQILADEQVDSLSSPGEVLWPLTDHLGTVRDLASYDDTTDTTSVVNHIAYDAFGRVTSQSNAAVDHLFGYTGREWDSAVDLQYNRARWYDPSIGRWLSEDPIGFAAGDANLRRYVGNQVTVQTDPSGLLPPSTGFVSSDLPFGPPPTQPQRPFGALNGNNCYTGFTANNQDIDELIPQPLTDDDLTLLGNGGIAIAGILVEPIDWLITGIDIYNDPTDPYNYAGLLPIVPAGGVRGIRNAPDTGGSFGGGLGSGGLPNFGSLRKMSDSYLRKLGIDAERFKASIVGNAASRFNIAVGTNGEVFLIPVRKGEGAPVQTHARLEDLPSEFPLRERG